VAAFDDTTEEGVGGEIYVPVGATYLRLNLVHRAATGPTGDQTIVYRFRWRKITDNGAIGSWQVWDTAVYTIPNGSTDYQYEEKYFSLAGIGMDAGAYYQFELTRYVAATSDTLTGDLYLRKLRLETERTGIRWIPADAMRSAVNSDWAVNANAPVAADSNNAALKCRRHSDSVEEGCGFTQYVPGGVAKMKLHIISRAEQAPGTTAYASVSLHYREIDDNGPISAWYSEDFLVAVTLPTNEYWQEASWEVDLAGLATPINPGSQYQFQITRNVNAVYSVDDLTGDWDTLAYGTEYY
jgi:hypothetical protein